MLPGPRFVPLVRVKRGESSCTCLPVLFNRRGISMPEMGGEAIRGRLPAIEVTVSLDRLYRCPRSNTRFCSVWLPCGSHILLSEHPGDNKTQATTLTTIRTLRFTSPHLQVHLTTALELGGLRPPIQGIRVFPFLPLPGSLRRVVEVLIRFLVGPIGGRHHAQHLQP